MIEYLSPIVPNLQEIRVGQIDSSLPEDQIAKSMLMQVTERREKNYINSIVLCYYCKKYDENSGPNVVDDKSQIRRYAEAIKLGKDDNNLNVFYELYAMLYPDEAGKSLSKFKKEFIDHYLMERYLDFIMEDLNQSKNLSKTLRKIIKEGELSRWGITEESVKTIETELRMKSEYGKVFLVIGQKIPESIANYLRSLPHLGGWAPYLRKSDKKSPDDAKYSGYVVKASKFKSASELLEEIRSKYESDIELEKMIWVVPLDFLKSDEYNFPANKEFSSLFTRQAYEQMSWFRGYGADEQDIIFGVISKSKVKIEELLTVLPFNILCPGLMPNENDFLVQNYSIVKNKMRIETLTDFLDVKPEYLTNILVNIGEPEYEDEEVKTLKFSNPPTKVEIAKRLGEIAVEIVNNALNFSNAIEGNQ